MMQSLIIDLMFSGQRIDNFLMARMKSVPKTRLYRALRKGEVRVNSRRISASYRLQMGDTLRIPPLHVKKKRELGRNPPPSLVKTLDSRVIFEDEGLLVLNKPAGIPVHGGTGVSWGLIEAIRKIRPQKKWSLELIHRLDRETSGCLLIAKKLSLLREWHKRLVQRKVKKKYQLLVKGKWEGGLKRVTARLEKNIQKNGERIVRVSQDGKEALTVFTLIRQYQDAALLSAKIHTGRTHQIRVHAQHLKYPIAGDMKYGDNAWNRKMKSFGLRRLFLHCSELENFSSKLDEDLLSVLERLKEAHSEIPYFRHSISSTNEIDLQS